MMSQSIPGGRARASSDGDILDEKISCFVVGLDGRRSSRKSVKKVNSVLKLNESVDSCNADSGKHGCYNYNYDSSNDVFDSEGDLTSHVSTKSLKRSFFKSMKKAVSSVSRVVKDSSSTSHSTSSSNSRLSDSASKRSEKPPKPGDLKSSGARVHRSNGSESSDSGTMSTARPLITDSSLVEEPVRKWKNTPGTVGLYNHGNSCFMNAVLQCLSNTDSFTEYFVKDLFRTDLKNSSNGKKGMFRSSHGEVTEQLGYLLKCLWTGKYTAEVSKEFKSVVGKFNGQYKGDHQHDAQEFLLWLLGRVHEDISTNHKKKVKPQKSPVLKSDEELAWEAASVNGDSFVLKLFQALHSSTLTCPTCGQRSCTFDPYLCVSLPLPQRCLRDLDLVLVYQASHHYHEVKMVLTLNQHDSVRDLRERISAIVQIPVRQLLLVQLKEDGFGATYSDDQPVADIPENDLVYAFETSSDEASMQSSAQEFDSPTSLLLVVHVEVATGSNHCYRFGNPVMLRVRRDITWKGLQKEILLLMKDCLSEELQLALSLKLGSLLKLRIFDGSSSKSYLPSDVDMPLYTQPAERGYTALDEDFGPAHLKIIAEWDSQTKSKYVIDDEEHIEVHESVLESQKKPHVQSKVSLEECFKLYTQEEKLTGEDAWMCPHCQQQQQGTIKSLRLWSLPNILVLHLKRFKQSGLDRSKLNTLVEFPVEDLDMSAHLSNRNPNNQLRRDDYCYDLIGVSNHYGNMTGGHYIAFCRSPVDGEWREFNDTKVRSLEGSVVTREAYLLFYQRRSVSKDVNKKLFMGDHWVFSLPLAPSETVHRHTTVELTPSELPTQHGRSRSRSASPSAHRQSNGITINGTRRVPSRPLTPQPVRRPFITNTKDPDSDNDSNVASPPPSPDKGSLSRKSRPVQRQASAPGPFFRREKSAGATVTVKPKEPSRTRLYNRKSLETDHRDLSTDEAKKPAKFEQNGELPKTSAGIIKVTEKPPLPVLGTRHEPSKSTDSVATSKTAHQSTVSTHLPSEARPTSSHYDLSKYDDSKMSVTAAFVPAHNLQVKFDDADNYSSRALKSSHNPPVLSETDAARKMLAQRKKPENILVLSERDHSLGSIDSIEEEHNKVPSVVRGYQPQKRSDLTPRSHHYDNGPSLASVNGLSYRKDTRDTDYVHDQKVSVRSRISNRAAGYNLLDESEIDYFSTAPDASPESILRSHLQAEGKYQTFAQLASQHFQGDAVGTVYRSNMGSRFYDEHMYRGVEHQHTSGYVSTHLNGDESVLNKYATTSRASNQARPNRYDRDKDNIPRSNTDHNIHYNNNNNNNSMSLPPPPSPTPPHSLVEERTLNQAVISASLPATTSQFLTSGPFSREVSSSNHYDFSSKRSSDQDIMKGYTLPARITPQSRFNFRSPRASMNFKQVKPTVSRNPPQISNPCLRESSV